MSEEKVYPVESNGFYLTVIDKDYKSIRCVKDYQGRFFSGETYKYKLSKHSETGIRLYIVCEKEIPGTPGQIGYFTKTTLSRNFDTTSIFREEKLNQLGI
jgi:hypothetical protein